jgi:hypothetical protein
MSTIIDDDVEEHLALVRAKLSAGSYSPDDAAEIELLVELLDYSARTASIVVGRAVRKCNRSTAAPSA